MGWCSGTTTFDAAISAAIECGVKGNELVRFAEKLIVVFENEDWDCQYDSDYFAVEGPVRQAFKNIHPSWDFEE